MLFGAALVEGRVLLDLMTMQIRNPGKSVHEALFGAMDVFSAPLAEPCSPELRPAGGSGFREVLLCPLRFGALGLDALRYASTVQPAARELAV